jgi:hypothetical protein
MFVRVSFMFGFLARLSISLCLRLLYLCADPRIAERMGDPHRMMEHKLGMN